MEAVITLNNKPQHSPQWWLRLLGLVIILFAASSIVIVANPDSGYRSDSAVDMTGTATSGLTIGSSGTDNSDRQLATGPTLSTLAPTNVAMNSGTHATLNGNLSSLNGFPQAVVWFEWGYDTSYGNTVGTQTVAATGQVSTDIAGFDPDRDIHYRFNGETEGIIYGGDVIVDADASGWYMMANILPYIFLATAIIMVISAYMAGLPLVPVIIGAAILATLGAVGTEVILRAMQSLW